METDFFKQNETEVYINLKDNWGESVLGDAVYYNHFECAKVILEKCGELLYVPNSWGQTPLHYAVVYSKKPEMVKLLIDGAEARLLTAVDTYGKIALEAAIEQLNLQIANMIDASQIALQLLADPRVNELIETVQGKKAYADLQFVAKAYADHAAKKDAAIKASPSDLGVSFNQLEEKYTRLLQMYKDATGLEPTGLPCTFPINKSICNASMAVVF